jgi:hypothetical protein
MAILFFIGIIVLFIFPPLGVLIMLVIFLLLIIDIYEKGK